MWIDDRAQWTVTAAHHIPSPEASWQTVTLPDSLSVQRHEGSYFGHRPHGFDAPWYWYRFNVPDHALDERELGLFIPRYTDRLRVYLNGEEIARSFQESDRIEHGWNRPFFAALPAGLLNASNNQLMLALDSPYLGRVQLTRPRIGDIAQIRELYEREYFFRVRSAEIATAILAVLSTLGFGTWLARRQETMHLLMGFAAGSFAVRQAHFFVVTPWWSPDLFWWLAVISIAWAMCMTLLLALRHNGKPAGLTEISLIAIATLSSVLVMPGVGLDAYNYAGIIYLALTPIAIIAGTILLKRAISTPSLPHTLLATGYLLNLIFNLNDLTIQQRWVSIERFYLGPMGAVLLCASFIMALMARYLQTLAEVESLNKHLETRVEERQRELEHTYTQLHAATAEQAKAEERQRLMREIHDGIGAQLTVALAATESSNDNSIGPSKILRSAITDLKLTVDSLEPVDGDLTSLVGNLRYRLTPQLRQAGIDVKWEVTPLPLLEWLQAPHALHILRLLQEAFSNIIQHAVADTVEVATGISNDKAGLWVKVRDNGRGLKLPSQPGGRGLKNMHERARILGGDLEIQPANAGGTLVKLWLPFEKPATRQVVQAGSQHTTG